MCMNLSAIAQSHRIRDHLKSRKLQNLIAYVFSQSIVLEFSMYKNHRNFKSDSVGLKWS